MPPPPPPPPPGPGLPPPPLSGGSKGGGAPNRSALLDQIHHGARLKKTVTNDRSAPQLSEGKSTAGSSGSRGRGGDTPMGGLFAGGVPKLRPPGQSKVPGSSSSLALKPPSSMSNGPTTAHAHDNDYHSNGGPPPLPPSINKPQANKQGPPAPPPSFSKPNNTGPPPIPDNSKSSNVGPPGRLNLNAFKQFNDSNVHENKIKLDTPRSNAPMVSGGHASNNTPNRPAIPKLPGSSGGSPAASGMPPPPPSRPSPSDATRPNSIMNRPLPPPPGDNGTATVSPPRVPPPPPRVPAPPPSISKTAAAPPPPPQRIAPNITAGGTIGRSTPPSIKPPVPSSLPSPPKTRPPSGSRTPGNEDDFESRFMFHQIHEFSLPEPVNIMTKTYPSKKTSDRQRPPPPQPPR